MHIGQCRAAVIALLAAVVCAVAAGCSTGNPIVARTEAPPLDKLAIVRSGEVFLTDSSMMDRTPIGRSGVIGVAFDDQGHLWLAQAEVDEGTPTESCRISSRDGGVAIAGEILSTEFDRGSGGCELTTGPNGTLYTTVHNGTMGSSLVVRVDPRSLASAAIVPGSNVASSHDGNVVSAVQHRYSADAAPDGPVATLVGPGATPTMLEPRTTGGYYGAAAPRDAATLAVADERTILTGPLSGPLTNRCLLPRRDGASRAEQLVWLSDGRILARALDGVVYECRPDGDVRVLIRGVEMMAVG